MNALTNSLKNKIIVNQKAFAVVVIAAVALIIMAAQASGAFLCRLGNSSYVGQAVDAEQAIAKLASYSGGVADENSPPASFLVYNATKSKYTEFTAWQGNEQARMKGFVLDVPYRSGSLLYYGDAYLLNDQGYLYKLSSANC